MRLWSPDVLLGGERHAMPIRGFDFSNSPLEYTVSRVHGKGIVLTTTNGTLAVSKCGQAAEILIGSFLNHQSTVTYLLHQNRPVELVCAGTNGEFSLDDFLCAGLFCSTLQGSAQVILDDLGRLAVETWEIACSDIHEALSSATHYNILKSKSFYADLEFCLKIDTHNILIRNQDMKFVNAG
jgi:2-phosphosulfolactate phosphatase